MWCPSGFQDIFLGLCYLVCLLIQLTVTIEGEFFSFIKMYLKTERHLEILLDKKWEIVD